MAEFEMKCPHCGLATEVKDEWIGMKTECPSCHKSLIIPQPSSADGTGDGTFIFICPECDAVTELPLSVKGQQYECKRCCETSVASPAEERKCPYCGKKIKIKATVCKHCRKKVPSLAAANSFFSVKRKEKTKKMLNDASVSFAGIMAKFGGLIGWKNTLPLHGWVLVGLVPVVLVFFYFANTVNVDVTVKDWLAENGNSWKWGCEYKLYADDQLIASRNTKDMSVTFHVRVRKGTVLRGEMYPRNGFGAITKRLQGTVAVIADESLHIECR